MSRLQIFLFGRCDLQLDGRALTGLEAHKTQELFSYLLLHRGRAHLREKLATLLWCDHSPAQSRRYLRQALWQLQTFFGQHALPGGRFLIADPEWLEIDPAADFWLDVAEFERAYDLTQGQGEHDLEADLVERLAWAVSLYRGDLLENWYQEWCIFERERLQAMYLAMLDKLMAYCELHQAFEAGIVYGTHILRCDRARERTHRRLMRLHYLAGDRTGALRQYERCRRVLAEELGVEPAQRTDALLREIRADRPVLPAQPGRAPAELSLSQLLAYLTQLRLTLAGSESVVADNIAAIQQALDPGG